jgi:A/G-specific adenine glycosylase
MLARGLLRFATVLGRKSTYQQRLLGWFYKNQRPLPWRAARGERPDPYRVLLSEAMLQQTQVATVIPYFHRFLQALPTLADLAAADEQTVLRLWQGLGYYSRARNLRRAAQAIVAEHGGVVPRDVPSLLALPGVGRYTAGAIASIAYDTPAPILDGNVARVLCRLDAITADPRERTTQQRLWSRAEELLPPRGIGDFNQALMELGATVCTPRNPQCLICPVREHCRAREQGIAERIPPPKQRPPSPLLRRVVLVVADDATPPRWLLEQRPARGRWAGLWQFPTVDADTPAAAAASLGLAVTGLRSLGEVAHTLTHRRYAFAVYAARLAAAAPIPPGPAGPRVWVAPAALGDYPLSRPQLLAADLARESGRVMRDT